MGKMLEFNITELTALSKKLNGYKLSKGEQKQLLTDLGTAVESQTRERFDTKTAPDGTKWAPLAESTKKYLAKNFPSAQPPLVRTGFLRDSTQYKVHGSAVRIGQSMHYAKYLQDGTKKKDGSEKMPARPSLGLSDEDVADLGAITDGFMKRMVK